MSRRIYIVTNGAADPRLVRATNQAQVMRHLVKPYTVEYAEQDALLAAYEKGVKVEEAKDDAE